jgi:FAD/FMN-containing dehydrogenase
LRTNRDVASNMRRLSDHDVGVLRARLRGLVLTRGDPGYDASRRLWNGRIERHPAAIARCTHAADIVACVRFARERELDLAVCGSGHAVAGTAMCDNGLVVDLSGMKGIRIDPRSGRAWVEAGETWGAVDRATQAFGLAVPAGTDSEVGVAGLTLGGGNGWLMGAFGATVDNLLSTELVLASGEVVTASANDHPDLFWAVRGGGGNFGIATKFEFALHPVGPVGRRSMPQRSP